MKKVFAILPMLLCGCLAQVGNTSESGEFQALEVIDVEILVNSGSGVRENVSVARTSMNPPCFKFSRASGEPGTVGVVVDWTRPNSNESIGETEAETRILKRGESETVCLPLPKGVSGKIAGSFVFYPDQ